MPSGGLSAKVLTELRFLVVQEISAAITSVNNVTLVLAK
jgi:hypothetical protein